MTTNNLINKDISLKNQEKIKKIKKPVYLKLYIAKQCPFCPMVLKKLEPINFNKFIRLKIVDAGIFPEAAQADKVQSVPTLILNEQFRWTGSINLEEILDVLINKNPASLSTDSMERMVKEGNADKLAKMMLEAGNIFGAFPDLIAHEKWPVRLGAMVTAETISSKDKNLASCMIPDLWKHFHKSDDAIKGDILYIIGISGDNSNISDLQKISAGYYALEIKEAAQEAVENIIQRLKEE